MDRQAAQNTQTPLFSSPFVLLVLPTSYSGTLIVCVTDEVRGVVEVRNNGYNDLVNRRRDMVTAVIVTLVQ